MVHSSDETRPYPKHSEQIEQLASQFREEYRQGSQPSIEAYLDRFHGDRVQLLRALILVEWELRKDAETSVDPGEYLQRFPGRQIVVRSVIEELDQTEFADTTWNKPFIPVDFGDYRLIRKIGQGGMGIVYEAEQKSLGNRRRALKTIKHVGEVDERLLKRFRTEVEAVAQLEHRHIIPVYDVGMESGIHFYVMKFIEGHNLRELIRMTMSAVSQKKTAAENPNLTPKSLDGCGTTERSTQQSGWSKGDTLASNSVLEMISKEGSTAHPQFVRNFARMGIQISEALHHAHQQGVVHRDIKPANLLLDIEGDVWLADFGLAMIRDQPDFTAPGTLVGTYHYMSPEQAMGSKRVIVDHRTDIYSLGVTLYELLTLRRAFPGATREEVLHRVQFDDPLPVRKIAPRVPVDLETIVMKAMAKSPNARFQSASEMAAELQRFLDGKPLSIRPPSALERIGYWARSNRHAVISLATVLLVIFVGSIASSFLLMQEQAETQAALESEQEQRAEVEKQKDEVTQLLQQSDGLRLAANSLLQVESDPDLGLRLGIESAKRHPGSDSNDAIMRALDAGRAARTLAGHTAPVGHLAFNQDGSKLISAATTMRFMTDEQVGSAEPAIVWETDNGDELGRIRSDRTITSAVFSPDNALVLTTSSPELRLATNELESENEALRASSPSLWDATSFRPLVTFDEAYLFKADRHCFSPDGLKIVLPIKGNQAAVYFCAGTRLVVLQGHDARVITAAFNDQGDQVVTYADDNTVRVWDANTGAQLLMLDDWRHPNAVVQPRELTWIEFTPDGRRLAIGSRSGGIEIRDLENNGAKLNQERVPGSSAVLFGNGDLFAATTGNRAMIDKRLVIRNINHAQWIEDLPINKLLRKVVISPDNHYAGVLHYDYMPQFQIWDLAQRKLVGELGGGAQPIHDLAFSPDSKLIATASNDGNVRLWYVENGRDRATFASPTHFSHPVAATSPDGATLSIATAESVPAGALCDFSAAEQSIRLDAELVFPAAGGKRFLAAERGRLAVHSIEDGRFLQQETPLQGIPNEAAINRAGDRVAVSTDSNNVLLWDPVNNHRRLLSTGNAGVNQLRFSLDGERLFAISNGDGKIRVWDKEGNLIDAIDNGGNLSSFTFSADGTRFAVAENGNTAVLYDAETLKEIRRFGGANQSIDRIRFSHDGNSLVTYRGLQSISIAVWEIESGDKQAELDLDGTVGVAIHPSQPELLAWSSKQGALIWRYQANEQLPVTDLTSSSGAYSTDGKSFYVATSATASGRIADVEEWPDELDVPKVTRWDREAMQAQESVEFPLEAIHQILISDQDQVFVRAYRMNQVVSYGMKSHQPISTIPGHFAPISECLATSDSKRLITTSWDARVATWTVADGSLVQKWNHGSPVLSAAISSDDKFLVTGARDGSCRIWDLEQSTAAEPVSNLVALSDAPIHHVALSTDANRVLALSNNGQASLIDRASGEKLAVDLQAESIEWAEFAPDGASLLVIPTVEPQAGRHLVLVVALDGSAVTEFEYPAMIKTSHFHPNSQGIITATNDGVVSIQEIQTRETKQKLMIETRFLRGAVYDSTGEFVFVSEFNAASIWSVSDGQRWLTVEDADGDRIWCHTRDPFAPGEERRVITRRFVPARQNPFRDSPLIPLEAANARSAKALTPAETRRFLIPNAPPAEKTE